MDNTLPHCFLTVLLALPPANGGCTRVYLIYPIYGLVLEERRVFKKYLPPATVRRIPLAVVNRKTSRSLREESNALYLNGWRSTIPESKLLYINWIK
jgi:hypothetical protein